MRPTMFVASAGAVAMLLTVGCGSAAAAQSACDGQGGTVDANKVCRLHTATTAYELNFDFPVDYPDEQALADVITDERATFVDWVTQYGGDDFARELNISGDEYRSGAPDSGTASLVLTIGRDSGVHPVTEYRALNYDLGAHAPITFATLFTPGSRPLDVLNPIVEREIDKRGGPGAVTLTDLGADAYRNFAITDDAVIFFFDQDVLLPHTQSPFKVSVPRTDIASLLA